MAEWWEGSGLPRLLTPAGAPGFDSPAGPAVNNMKSTKKVNITTFEASRQDHLFGAYLYDHGDRVDVAAWDEVELAELGGF